MGPRMVRAVSASAVALVMVLMAALPGQPRPVEKSVRAPAPLMQALTTPPPFRALLLPPNIAGPQLIDPQTYDMYKGPNLGDRVVLTYDDCPRDLATLSGVLRFVHRNNIGIVLAPTGECIDRFKKQYKADIVQMARDHGQYVINHSYSHPNLTKLKKKGKPDAARLRAELGTEAKADYGRPPYGAHNKTVDAAYAAAGMRLWLWTLDTNDWRDGGRSEAAIVSYVVKHAKAGDTVLMHMQHKGFTPTAISRMRSELRGEANKPNDPRGGANKLELCRAFRGWDNPANGPITRAPAKLERYALAC